MLDARRYTAKHRHQLLVMIHQPRIMFKKCSLCLVITACAEQTGGTPRQRQRAYVQGQEGGAAGPDKSVVPRHKGGEAPRRQVAWPAPLPIMLPRQLRSRPAANAERVPLPLIRNKDRPHAPRDADHDHDLCPTGPFGVLPSSARTARATCTFTLGFAAVQARIPTAVGQCRDDERFTTATGLAVQHTTRGTLTWNKAWNDTTFTDDTHTWILGAHGLHERLNTELFGWESTGWKVQGIVGDGQLAALPAGPLALSITAISQPAGTTLALPAQIAFIHVITGSPPLSMTLGSQAMTTTIEEGQTAFTDGGAPVTVTNASAVTSSWYLVSIHAPGQSLLPVTAVGTAIYTTGILPGLPSGPTVLTLRQIVMAPGGRGAAHKHSGIEIVCALQGTVKMVVAGQAPMILQGGRGMYHLPNTGVQEFNAGGGMARMMVLLITAHGLPLRSDIDTTP